MNIMKDMTPEGVDETLDRRWSEEASMNSSGMERACEVGVLRMSHHVCKVRTLIIQHCVE
jgi:hypothetical protein